MSRNRTRTPCAGTARAGSDSRNQKQNRLPGRTDCTEKWPLVLEDVASRPYVVLKSGMVLRSFEKIAEIDVGERGWQQQVRPTRC